MVSRFPMVGRDVTVKVKTNVAYEVVKAAITDGLAGLLYEIEPK